LKEEVTMFGLGMPELIVVLVIALVIFGPSRLPSMGKGIGEAIRGLKKGLEEEPAKEKENENEKIEKENSSSIK
jgi:sec-independent protein translocase protein TatA